MKKNNKGFSLVELIVVIAIMAILAAVAIPTFAGFITKANESADDSFLNDIKYAIELGAAKDGGLKSTDTIVVIITAGKVSSITLNGTAVYNTASGSETDTYELKQVVELTTYSFKSQSGNGSFAPSATKAGHWDFTPATP